MAKNVTILFKLVDMLGNDLPFAFLLHIVTILSEYETLKPFGPILTDLSY